MRRTSLVATAALAVAIPMAAVGSASASTYKVNSRADLPSAQCKSNKGAKCSLRGAVIKANAHPGPDVIKLKNSSYPLTKNGADEDGARKGDLDISSEILLRGSGSKIRVKVADRAFDVLAGGQLDVQNLQVGQGSPPDTESGGGFQSVGTLSLQKSKVLNNVVSGAGASGGGVYNNGGSLSLIRTKINNNSSERAGGAIEANGGTTTLNAGSQLNNNSAGPTPGNGGALHLTGSGAVAVSDSSVGGNSATAEGGGLWNSATGTMTVTDTTLSGNTANGVDPDQGGGALYNDGGTLTVNGSKLDGNSATGTSGSGGGILNVAGTLNVDDSTISGGSAQRAGGGIESNTGSVTLTKTDIDSNAAGPMPGNGGAVHLTGAATLDVTGGSVTNNTAASEGGGLWNSATGTLTVDRTAIIGNTASGAAADNGGGGVFSDGGATTITNAVVSSNAADGDAGSGGGVFSNTGGNLDVSETVISNNTAVRAGGGVELVGAGPENVTLTGVNLKGNAATSDASPMGSPGNGGGLHVSGSPAVSVTASLVRENNAASEGGGLWNATGTMTVDSTVIRNNTASGPASDNGGGGIYQLTAGTLVVQNGSSIVGNSADGAAGSGGGILNDGATVTVNQSDLVNNDASRAGGGIEGNAGTTNVDSATFSGNSTGAAPGNGGAIHLGGAGSVTVDGSSFTNNSATNEGGGVWNSPAGTFTVTDSSLSNGVTLFNNGNSAPNGPNGYQDDSATVTGALTINGVLIAAGDPGV